MNEQMPIRDNPFYGAYDRKGQGVRLKAKHIRQFNRDFVAAGSFVPTMSVLELGCGNGLFLHFLHHLGTHRFVGVDGDPRVLKELPPNLTDKVTIADFSDFFVEARQERFDRVVLFDVLEHFSAEDGTELLRKVATLLSPGGRIIVRTPNMGSPFALGVQYNDVTHLTCYTPGSLSQVARVAGLRLISSHPQAYASAWREVREKVLTSILSWFLAAPPTIWSPNFIGVLEPAESP